MGQIEVAEAGKLFPAFQPNYRATPFDMTGPFEPLEGAVDVNDR